MKTGVEDNFPRRMKLFGVRFGKSDRSPIALI